MALLSTDFQDDVLDTTQNTRRKYNMIDNGDGTVSFEDVTEYTITGSEYGAGQVNTQNAAINAKVTLGGTNVETVNFVLTGTSLNITTS